MSDTALATTNNGIEWATLEKVVIQGDLSNLQPADRIAYYRTVCQSLGLNPATQPFEYIKLNGRLVLYAKRDATEQLRRIHNVSVQIVGRDRLEDVYIVTARATMPNGRTDESTGVVSIGGLKGDNLANALMKCETKAKRRVTLSICGLGMLDESETETIPGATVVHETIDQPAPAKPAAKLDVLTDEQVTTLVDYAASLGIDRNQLEQQAQIMFEQPVSFITKTQGRKLYRWVADQELAKAGEAVE